MRIETILNINQISGRTALSEYDSKRLLKAYGIPVIAETVAVTPKEAARAAAQTGFPVVLKGMGARLLHKTERGLVHLNLKDADDVRLAAESIQSRAGDDLEGFFLGLDADGKREKQAQDGSSQDETGGSHIVHFWTNLVMLSSYSHER
mgnify:CR=1 FL=1